MRPAQGSAWGSEVQWKGPYEILARTQEDAHREVQAIAEARTVVHRDVVIPTTKNPSPHSPQGRELRANTF